MAPRFSSANSFREVPVVDIGFPTSWLHRLFLIITALQLWVFASLGTRSFAHENPHHHGHDLPGYNCGTRHPTTFERGLDQLRMNALVLNKQNDGNSNNHPSSQRRNDGSTRTHLDPSCTKLCKQCVKCKCIFIYRAFHWAPNTIMHPIVKVGVMRSG